MSPEITPHVHARINRRQLLSAACAVAGVGLAGCLGNPSDGSERPDPADLSGGLDCDACGMIIGNHSGPNGQLFFQEEGPEGHDNPARFDSLKQCFFPYKLEREQLGWTLSAAYVTDYSSVEYTLQDDGGTTYISSFPGAEAFADARDLTYVVGSDVEGAMGPDFIPFSEPSHAEAFAGEYGGQQVAYGDIDEGLVGR